MATSWLQAVLGFPSSVKGLTDTFQPAPLPSETSPTLANNERTVNRDIGQPPTRATVQLDKTMPQKQFVFPHQSHKSNGRQPVKVLCVLKYKVGVVPSAFLNMEIKALGVL